MPVSIADLQNALPVPRGKIQRLVGRILRGEGMGRARISLALVDNRRMRALNRRWLGHDRTTDVLSFLLEDREYFGEVVVSAPVARAEARRRRIAPEEELLRYVAHGVLHLLGYDDTSPAKKKRMWARQERYLLRPRA